MAVEPTPSLPPFLPELGRASSPSRPVFWDARRAATDPNAAAVAREPIARWVEAPERAAHPLPAHPTLVTADSRFHTPSFIDSPAAKGASVCGCGRAATGSASARGRRPRGQPGASPPGGEAVGPE
jgi:hypothetical protein